MNFSTYKSYFNSVLISAKKEKPYDNPEYLNYATLNWFRQERWFKNGILASDLIEIISGITDQHWIFITEPWCGDAAHILPFVVMHCEKNQHINLEIKMRDVEPFLIDNYLSGQSRSIPKLIVRNSSGVDLFTWGSRPQACQNFYDELTEKKVDHCFLDIELQKWYNADKGQSFQRELFERLRIEQTNI